MASFASRASVYDNSPVDGGNKPSWQGARDPPAYANDRPFPHVKDIIATAQPLFDPSIPLTDYLKQAEACLSTSKTSLSFGKIDIAFREYLRACEIVLNIIPRHKDFGFFDYNNAAWSQRNKNVQKVVSSMQTQMEGVRKMIEDNNARHNTQQQSTTSGYKAVSSPTSGYTKTESRPLSQGGTSSNQNDGLPDTLRISKARPMSVSKPDHLRSGSLAPANDLTSRFAALRTSGPTSPTSQQKLDMPDPANFVSNGSNGVPKPYGPREMPPTSFGPAIPPKMALPQSVMPKPPDPSYSSIQSARSSQEVHRPPTERKHTYYGQPITSAPNPQLQKHKDEMQPYRPRTPNGVNLAIISKNNSAEMPHSDTIEAETLSQYMAKYNVLIVDIRDRTFFDEGHIMATSIICIEPISLKEGTSAEALEERLIMSPENEQLLFSRRNEFDLVVYYDQRTTDTSYLKGAPNSTKAPHLRAFFDTLYEFNEYKPLKDGRRPALLRGGIDAWVDYLGTNSLATSRTAVTLGTTRQRLAATPGRPALGRQRLVSTNSRFEVRDRRLRNYKFLDENEQQAWRQQAQQEEVSTHDYSQSDNDYTDEEPEPPSPFIPDYETFLRKFPPAEQQSMVAPPRRPVVPPKRHEPPPLPAIPSRPTPAVPRPSYSGQADIIQPSAPLARVTSSTKQPLYSSSLALRSRKLPRTGLTNFGVTCYMNSTLQCLSATLPLATFFMNDSTYKSNVQKNWKGSSGIMPEIFANVVRSLWKGDVDMIKPTTFRNFCGRMNREWVIDRQQDAKEFFDFLVDCLHEDLNIAWERTPLKPLSTEQELQRERYKITDAAPIEWQRYEHRDRSLISSLFAGQHASRLRCLTCRGTSTTYEAFYSISIEIPRSGAGDIYRCLQSYTQEERLAPDERWKCPYCKTERDATKQIILTRLPQFLVIHFKRFSASKTEAARKIHTPIDFPLHNLRMDDFILSATPPTPTNGELNGVTSQASTANPSGQGSTPPDPATLPPFSYDCYGVLRHLGASGDGGHYISLIKDQGRNCWRRFDDERTHDFDPGQLSPRDRLQNSEAYILFYQRGVPR